MTRNFKPKSIGSKEAAPRDEAPRGGPDAVGPKPPPAEAGDTLAIGKRLMTDVMRDFGFNEAQAAGVVGNLAHESGGFKTLQEISPVVKGSRGGYGYAQWTGPRRRAYEAWVKERGLDPRSYDANYGFLKHELLNTSEGRVLKQLRQARSADEAARIFSNVFLRPGTPHMASRLRWTERFL